MRGTGQRADVSGRKTDTAPGLGSLEANRLRTVLVPPARLYGLELAPETLHLLARYYNLLLAWGSRINLTGARTAQALVEEHFLDALPLAAELPPGPFQGVDVGSGAGLPGVLLACLRPASRWTLLEPNAKKYSFLRHAARELMPNELGVFRERLDEHTLPPGGYDVAVSRAVWPASEWLSLGRGLVRPGGRLLGVEGETPGRLPEGAVRIPYLIDFTGKNKANTIANNRGEASAGRRRAVIRLDL